MITLLPVLFLGLAILFLGGRLLSQTWGKSKSGLVTIDDYDRARSELEKATLDAIVIQRIFAREDWNFICQDAPKIVQDAFLDERQLLAVTWIRQTRKRLGNIMQLHRRLASYAGAPGMQTEFELAGRYLCFLLVSSLVVVVLRLYGPFETVRIVDYAVRMSEEMCSGFTPHFERIDHARLRAKGTGQVHPIS